MEKISFLISEDERAEFITLCTRYDLTPSQTLRGLCRLLVSSDASGQLAANALSACAIAGLSLPLSMIKTYGEKGGQK